MKASSGLSGIAETKSEGGSKPFLIIGDERFVEVTPGEGSIPKTYFDTSEVPNPPPKDALFHHLGVVIYDLTRKDKGKDSLFVAEVESCDASSFLGIAKGTRIKVPFRSIPEKNHQMYLGSRRPTDPRALVSVTGTVKEVQYLSITVGHGHTVEQVVATTTSGSKYLITLRKV